MASSVVVLHPHHQALINLHHSANAAQWDGSLQQLSGAGPPHILQENTFTLKYISTCWLVSVSKWAWHGHKTDARWPVRPNMASLIYRIKYGSRIPSPVLTDIHSHSYSYQTCKSTETADGWRKQWIRSPSLAHRRIALSPPQDANTVPFGFHATLQTLSWCPLKTQIKSILIPSIAKKSKINNR